MFRVALIAVVLSFVSNSFAQIIYEPVRYQYGDQNKFYYGGSDPGIIRYGMGIRDAAGRYGRVHGYDFVSGNIDTHREVSGEPEYVYSDCLGYQNARVYGFTATDARNEAYANLPTYFTKRDLMNAAIPTGSGWVVPAHAQPVRWDDQPMIRVIRSPRSTRRFGACFCESAGDSNPP